ncbi:MAG: thymidylate synthase ThyX [Kiritimatiellae bacterium]|nr:thymidylate synthase ThyX [Kiritimatiellia bacterium]MDD5520780.1 thymidylate synthase ThyX [Kiritimatiellia bacterium]
MKAQFISQKGSWREVADCANVTIHKSEGINNPSSKWKRKMILCEHSPIRELFFDFKWTDLKYWISVHFVRHKIGVEHYVRSQRTDRTGIDRDNLAQESLVEHRICINAQSLINISRKRLCNNASKETKEAWEALLETIKDKEPEIFSACVPDCIYRGWCYEFKSCGYFKTEQYKNKLDEYRKGINF